MLLGQIEPTSTGTVRVVGSLLVMLVVTVVAIFAYLQIERQLDHTMAVESDNRTWVLAQVEVDVQRLEVALLQAVLDPEPPQLERVRLAFDILYSRAGLVRRTPTLDALSIRQSDSWARLAGSEGLISAFLPLIDGPDDDLRSALPDMARKVHDLGVPVREMVVTAMSETMQLSDAARSELRETLYTFLVALVVTMIALTFLLATIYRLASAQKRYAKMLELAVHNLRATIESARDAVLIVNESNAVIAANKAGEEMLGREISRASPIPLQQFLILPDGSAPPENIRTSMECVNATGARLPVEVMIAPALTATGHNFKIAFLRDMSEQLERERRLAQATELARKGEETKDRFLAVMSHEMRTPLSGLLSAVDLLETSTELDAQQARLVDIVRGCGLGALEQVNNILELTRLSAKDANDYPHSDFDTAEIIQQLIRQYEVLAVRRGNTIRFVDQGQCHSRVRAPLPLLRRIVNNLLSNAIKFTRDGLIEVRLAAEPAEVPGFCTIRLAISDSGVGIAEADLERIFHNFETLDTSYSQAQEGTGLGLGIAKLAVEAMGGQISVESRLGEGTCFTVEFAAEVLDHDVQSHDAALHQPDQPMALKILLAEDNEINCALMERQLNRIGHQVTTASDGEEAIAAATADRFDIILMDISMPKVDGVTATGVLRQRGLIGTTPVIALTAQAAPNRVQMLRDAGMADVVIKPVAIGLLDQIMQRLVLQGQRSAITEGPADPGLIDSRQLDDLICDMGADFLRSMVARFENDMQATLSNLAAALESRDPKAVSGLAHKAAGAAAVLTFSALSAELRALENAAPDEPPESLSDRYRRIEKLRTESLADMQHRLHAA